MNQREDWRATWRCWCSTASSANGGAARRTTPRRRLARRRRCSPATTSRSSSTRSPSTSRPGLPTTTLDRNRSDLITVRVTDESVPDAGKERYALSLSIHGIERAGRRGRHPRRGGPDHRRHDRAQRRAGRLRERARRCAPSFARVLRESIIYFTYPNPDGWRRGSITEGGPFFQRYNGNGVDINRDWPDIGFSFRPYSGLSEPESRALSGEPDRDPGLDRPPVRGRRRPARAAARRRALLHPPPARQPRLRQERAHPRHRDHDPPRLRGGAPVVADRAAERRAAGRRPALRADRRGRHRLRADLRPDLGHRLRHDQLHDDGGARRLVRLLGRARRGRDRQRDVVLAPRQEHRLRPAHRAAPRRRQQGADLRAPGDDPRPGLERRSRRAGRRATSPATRITREEKAFQAGPPAGTTPQDDIDSGPTPARPRRQRHLPVRGEGRPAAGRRQHLQRRHARRRHRDQRRRHRRRQR